MNPQESILTIKSEKEVSENNRILGKNKIKAHTIDSEQQKLNLQEQPDNKHSNKQKSQIINSFTKLEKNNKDLLLQELSGNDQLYQDLTNFSKFNNIEIEKEYKLFEDKSYNNLSIVLSYYILISLLLMSFFIYTETKLFYITFPTLLCFLIYLITTILCFKMKINSSFSTTVKYVKFINLLIMSFIAFFLISLFSASNKKYSLVICFIYFSSITILEYIFNLRKISKLVYFIIITGYFLLYVCASFSSFKLEIVFPGLYPYLLIHECSYLVNYDRLLSVDDFNLDFIVSVQSNGNNFYDFEGFYSKLSAYELKDENNLDDSFEKYFHRKYNDTISDDTYNNTSNTTKDINNTNNNLNSALSTIPQIYIDLLLKNSTTIYDCYNYHHSEFIKFAFINLTTIHEVSVTDNKQYEYYIFDWFNVLWCMIYFFLSKSLNTDKRLIFIKNKEITCLSSYFREIINNFEIKIACFIDYNVVFHNNNFDKLTNSSNSSRNKEIKESKDYMKDSSDSYNISQKSYQNLFTMCNTQSISEEFKAILESYHRNVGNSNENNLNIEKALIIDNPCNPDISSNSISNNLNNLYIIFLILHNKSIKESRSYVLLGVFCHDNLYYNAFYRKVFYKKDNFIIEIILHDITNIKQVERSSLETKLKQKLFSKMAHEFKTPLIVIKSLISDLNDPEVDEKEKNKLSSYVYYLSDYITFLINDIIYYSNNKEISVLVEEVDIKELLDFSEGVANSLVAVMPGNKNNVRIEKAIDNQVNDYLIFSDKTKLKQILLNLISNSVKFTKYGVINIEASIVECNNTNNENNNKLNIQNDSKEDLNHLLKITVRDTGIGIKPEDLIIIKQNYEDKNEILSINTDYAYNQMGTGLGLGISKSLIKALNHEMKIESNYGKGTVIEILIKTKKKHKEIDCNIESCSYSNTNSRNYFKDCNSNNIDLISHHSKQATFQISDSTKFLDFEYFIDNNKDEIPYYNDILTNLKQNKINNSLNSDGNLIAVGKKHSCLDDIIKKLKHNSNKDYCKVHKTMNNKRYIVKDHYNCNVDDTDSTILYDNLKANQILNYDLRTNDKDTNVNMNNTYLCSDYSKQSSKDNCDIISRIDSFEKIDKAYLKENYWTKSYKEIKSGLKMNSSLGLYKTPKVNTTRKISVRSVLSNKRKKSNEFSLFNINNTINTEVNNSVKKKVLFKNKFYSNNTVSRNSKRDIQENIRNIKRINKSCIKSINKSKSNKENKNYYILSVSSGDDYSKDLDDQNIYNNNSLVEQNTENSAYNKAKSHVILDLNSNLKNQTSLIKEIDSHINTNKNAVKSKILKKTIININNTNINNNINTNNNNNNNNSNMISNSKNKKILVVDDTETIRRSIKKLLRSDAYFENYDILEASDGIELLNTVIIDQLQGNNIKLIITDENMEFMSGSAAIAILKQLEKESKINKIFIASLTAFSDEDINNNLIKLGADVVITKPLSITNKKILLEKFDGYIKSLI